MTEEKGVPGVAETVRVPPGTSSETIDARARRPRDKEPESLPPGTRIGPFVLEGVIGAGGMGVIYCARDEGLDRRVALKVLSDKLAADGTVVERFRREARSMAQLGSHPNIVQVLSAGREDELPHFVMELIEGQSIDQRLEQGPLTIQEAVTMLEQVVVALKIAHDRGILHRDIKPSNLMLTPSGTVKVLDFGLAKILQDGVIEKKLTQSNEILGSPHYMSPEQAKGRPLDKRSDIYSLGATFYHMLAGSPPFDDPSVLGILHKHISEPLPPIEALRQDVPPNLRALIVRMMAKEPDQRPQDLEEVQRILKGGETPRPATHPVSRMSTKDEILHFARNGGKLPSWSFTPLLRFELPWLLGLSIVAGSLNTLHDPGRLAFIGGVNHAPFIATGALFEWMVLRLSYSEVTFRMTLHIERLLFTLSIPFLLLSPHSVIRAIAMSWISIVRFRAIRGQPGTSVGTALLVAFFASLLSVRVFFPEKEPAPATTTTSSTSSTRQVSRTAGSPAPAIPTPIPAAEKLINTILDHTEKKVNELTDEKVTQ